MASQAYIDNLQIGDKVTFRHPWSQKRITRVVRGKQGTSETGWQTVTVKHGGVPWHRVARRHIIEE